MRKRGQLFGKYWLFLIEYDPLLERTKEYHIKEEQLLKRFLT